MKKKIYLIGNIPAVIDQKCIANFYNAQMQLTQIGFTVVNPIERLSNEQFSIEDATKKNFQELMSCDAIFVMPCFSYSQGRKNIELRWALDFNLLIINGVLDVTPDDSQELNIEAKSKRRKILVK